MTERPRYRTLLLDPPWNETGGGRIKRGADRHYALLRTRDIAGVVRASGFWRPAEHSHLWMWSTNSRLPDALHVGKRLGFEYKTNAVWAKVARGQVQIGLGQYMRGSYELLLFFTRGKGQHPSVWNGHRDVASAMLAARTRHSAKPACSYDLIERVSRGPRVELFARTARSGWDVWGNEAPACDNRTSSARCGG